MYFLTLTGTSDQKTAQFLNLLTGRALKWASAVWERGGKPTNSYNWFIELFKGVFDHQLEGVKIGEKLLTIQQGERRVAEYALEFHTLVAGSGWNDSALKAVFCQGLDPIILTELACRDEQHTIDSHQSGY